MAAISVPPEEAPMLNRIAEPMAGRMTAKSSSSISWSVRGPERGQMTSNSCTRPDVYKRQGTLRFNYQYHIMVSQ